MCTAHYRQKKRIYFFYLFFLILFFTFALEKRFKAMSNTEYITVKNASRKVLNRMRQLGEDKAQRLQEIQNRWDSGEYNNVDVVQL